MPLLLPMRILQSFRLRLHGLAADQPLALALSARARSKGYALYVQNCAKLAHELGLFGKGPGDLPELDWAYALA
jgi:hypothetical protein